MDDGQGNKGGARAGVAMLAVYDGPAITMWDSGPIRQENGQTVGTEVPPATNTPPSEGQDPHELPRRTPADRAMKSAFLTVGGRVIDTCGGAPCHSVTS